MRDEILDSVVESLFGALPIIHRRLLRIDFEGLNEDISRHHIMIMRILDRRGTLHVSEIARSLLISNPQMSHSIDRLIGLGLVERQPDATDRRVVNVALTGGGKAVLDQCYELVRENVKRQLSCLDDQEIEALSVSLNKLGRIGYNQGQQPSRAGGT